MAHGEPLTFKLSRVAHGQRNVMTSYEEEALQSEAKANREVMLPGVDIATAWAFQSTGMRVKRITPTALKTEYLSAKDLAQHPFLQGDAAARQTASDTLLAENGFAVFMPEKWGKLHHVVMYFDLIEKNEAPDTTLLEWLITNGCFTGDVARRTVARFTKKNTLGRSVFVLHPDDAARLKMATDVRVQLEAEAAAEHAKATS